MKKIIISALCIITAISSFAQQEGYAYGFGKALKNVFIDGEYKKCLVVRSVQHEYPAGQQGLQVLDAIIAIDGEPIDENYADVFMQKPQVVLTIKRIGNTTTDLHVSGVPIYGNGHVDEEGIAWEDFGSTGVFTVTQQAMGIEPIQIVSDPEVDLLSYTTFDFEFTDRNALRQKEVAQQIDTYLTNWGMARDKENPDVLIFIECYSDKREQYIPPTQSISTRYNTSYNYITKRWESQQHISSQERGNYNRIEYLTKLSISMADARRMQEDGKDSPMIWQADYETIFKDKAQKGDFETLTTVMLSGFPFKDINEICVGRYWYTGIIFDPITPGTIAGVIPDSPAEKAGIKIGDVIKKSSFGKDVIFKESLISLMEKSQNYQKVHCNYDNFPLKRYSEIRLDDSGSGASFEHRFYPFIEIYTSCRMHKMSSWTGKYTEEIIENDYEKKPLVFQMIDSNKKKKKVTIVPEKKILKDYTIADD